MRVSEREHMHWCIRANRREEMLNELGLLVRCIFMLDF